MVSLVFGFERHDLINQFTFFHVPIILAWFRFGHLWNIWLFFHLQPMFNVTLSFDSNFSGLEFAIEFDNSMWSKFLEFNLHSRMSLIDMKCEHSFQVSHLWVRQIFIHLLYCIHKSNSIFSLRNKSAAIGLIIFDFILVNKSTEIRLWRGRHVIQNQVIRISINDAYNSLVPKKRTQIFPRGVVPISGGVCTT